MDDADAQTLRFQRAFDVDFPAVQSDASTVARVNTGQNLHQRGFARAVFSHQRVHLARAKFESAVIQRVNAREILLNSLHFQYRLNQGVPS